MKHLDKILMVVAYYWMKRQRLCNFMVMVMLRMYMNKRNRSIDDGFHSRRVNTNVVKQDALESIIGSGGDRNCIWELQMNLSAFSSLCELLQIQGGLNVNGHVSITEQIATFLMILAHHRKNRSIQVCFYRLGEIISRYFNKVLCSILRVQSLLLANVEPVPEDYMDPRWKWFKGCLRALDDTYIDVTVPETDKSRYRTRKGRISTNVLGVYNRDMNFVYVLSGWEGSYYLVDVGYTNGRSFLAPYRGSRYHVQEWTQGNRVPRKYKEYFNKKHSSARNVIERCFELLKKRWAILRSPSFYPIKTQNHIILACCLLQNFI
ncbi:uncharacterized protein LOC113862425 [Abrus precatorius]|uniref:Uncharacterized protein LOC113862425 n=1 Tax=Abrus precatorius TaxID=3816 RepID=A0A8B8L7H9_ABRPR|nr:uncharacterized protein LOC113862425 [Abrus precatorius]